MGDHEKRVDARDLVVNFSWRPEVNTDEYIEKKCLQC